MLFVVNLEYFKVFMTYGSMFKLHAFRSRKVSFLYHSFQEKRAFPSTLCSIAFSWQRNTCQPRDVNNSYNYLDEHKDGKSVPMDN